MIAVLDARPGREPGCLTFTAYEARDVPGRFYLCEVYASAAAFGEHLQTQPVHPNYILAAYMASGT
jgi:quinol monooxygenase YgiN